MLSAQWVRREAYVRLLSKPREYHVGDIEFVAAFDVVQVLKDERVDVLVSYLPVGSEETDKFYAQCAIDANVAFVNALPVFIASDPQ